MDIALTSLSIVCKVLKFLKTMGVFSKILGACRSCIRSREVSSYSFVSNSHFPNPFTFVVGSSLYASV